MVKHSTILLILAIAAVSAMFAGCEQKNMLYSDAEYIMFSDTAAVYPVMEGDDYSFKVPVISTVTLDYDRTIAVEVIDEGSNAVEGRDYRLKSNTLTIPAGQNAAYVEVYPDYDSFDVDDTLSFNLQLVMPEQLKWDVYGNRTKVTMLKSCPFLIDEFTGYCVVTSLFLYTYPGAENTSYQRLIETEVSKEKENTVILHDWLFTGYDVTLTFDPSDPVNPTVSMDPDQILSDEESVFGQVNGDNRILVESSPNYISSFNSCLKSVSLWARVYVNNMSEQVGTVGHYYNVMEWVSDEEGERLKGEGM